MNQVSPRQLDALLAAPEAGPVCLIGAGGCGMSGLGHLLLDVGLSVTGSDVRDNDSCRSLRARGAVIQAGHHAKVIKDAPPRLVVYSSAVPLDNPVLAVAEQRGVPIVRRARLLAALMRRQRGVCVAGMHGKTTTTALLAYALDRLGLSPSFAVGAEMPQLSRQARWVEAVGERWFVAEADESDGTLGEFHPDQAILLNVDEEHMDYFAGLDDVCREFAAFAGQVREQVWYCADDSRLVSLMAGVPGAVSYGFNPGADYRVELAADTRGRTGAYFFVWHGGARLGGFYTRLLGEKNASNAAAVEVARRPAATRRRWWRSCTGKDSRQRILREPLLNSVGRRGGRRNCTETQQCGCLTITAIIHARSVPRCGPSVSWARNVCWQRFSHTATRARDIS